MRLAPDAFGGGPALMRRFAALADALAPLALDGLLVSHGPNIRYLVGFTGSSGLLLYRRNDGLALVTDFRYEEQASSQLPASVDVWVARDGLIDELAARLEEIAVSPLHIGFEAAHLTVRDRQELGERCGRVLWEEAPPLLEDLRSRKDEEEVGHIQEAVAIAESAFVRTLDRVEEGMTERQLAAELAFALRMGGSGPLPFPCIVAAGAGSSRPHAEPGDRPLHEGDLILFDFGATAEGYASDLTRTLTLGRACDWQRDLHAAVREAQAAAIEAVRPGVPTRTVDAAARAVLERRGLGDGFGHGTGHGIGLEVHEAPRLSRRSDEILQEGHVVTVEPGVYLPGRGGVRVEDDVVVTGDGARVLSRVSTDLVEL